MHVPKLFPLLHWFKNTFCFLCSSTPSHFRGGICIEKLNPHLDTLGTILDPGKVIFGHFFYFGHFPIEIPIEAEKIYQHGKELS